MIAKGKKWMNVVNLSILKLLKLKLSSETLNVQVSHDVFQLCFSNKEIQKKMFL